MYLTFTVFSLLYMTQYGLEDPDEGDYTSVFLKVIIFIFDALFVGIECM